MGCCQGYPFVEGGERVFEVDTSRIAYGSGAMGELGMRARVLGMTRPFVVTDAGVAALDGFAASLAALRASGCEPVVYAQTRVEPTNESFEAAIAAAREARPDGYISIGGGSAIDTAKAANLYVTHPAPFGAYVNSPVGEGRAVPAALLPHIACPTTAGTGSECTGIAIFDHLPIAAKTGIASPYLRPSLALIDPDWTATLPRLVAACSGFDVLAHALESYTARPYTQRPAGTPGKRPLSQGANPFSDLACLEALRLIGRYLERAVCEPNDAEARERMMFAATLAGIGFNNAGVQLPHAMAYAVAGLVRDFRPADYPPGEPLVPHGMAVVVSAPAVFRTTAAHAPQRHREVAAALGVAAHGEKDDEIGPALAERIRGLMAACGMPPSLAALGYGAADVPALIAGTLPQQRLLANAPIATDETVLGRLFTAALAA